MGRYFARRLLYLVMVFFIISIVLFSIYQLVPGDPVLMMMSSAPATMTPEVYARTYEELRISLGLDRGIVVQYFSWLGKLLSGNLGFSTYNLRPVAQLIATPLRLSVSLNIIVMLLVFSITIPMGIISAVKKNTIFDRVVQVISILGYSLPSFIFAIFFIFLFSVKLRLLPISGISTPGFTGTPSQEFWDRAVHMILPILTLTFGSLGGIVRYVRASMIEALRMDYIRTARAKGLREKVVIYSHAFRNSLIPLVNIMVGWFIGIFGGAMIAESIFLWNGMGKLMLDSLNHMDYSVALALNMFYMLLALIGNVLMDLGYVLVDPRVKFS
jgi:peptide/nickel transport system permease protein